jgi:multidrug resistance efflux pump
MPRTPVRLLSKQDLITEIDRLHRLLKQTEEMAQAAQTGADTAVRLAEAETKAAIVERDEAQDRYRREQDLRCVERNARQGLEEMLKSVQADLDRTKEVYENRLALMREKAPADVDTAALVILAQAGDKEAVEALRVRLMQRGLLGLNLKNPEGRWVKKTVTVEARSDGQASPWMSTDVDPAVYVNKRGI